jgi:hypothetical protein
MTDLERWQGDRAARDAWEAFSQTSEFGRGMRFLETYNRPVVLMQESITDAAKRQYYQAGFDAALLLLRNLPQAHYKKIQEQLPGPWEYVEPETEETDGG